MTAKAISPLRQRLIEDMTIRRLGPKTQHHYIRHVKSFADFLGRSPDTATAEDVYRYQLRLASIGAPAPTVNVSATALRFFFKVTLKRSDLADELVSAREPCRLYGLFANANRAANIALSRQLLGVPDPAPSSGKSGTDGGHEDKERNTCPCGERMIIVETLEPGSQPRLWPFPSIGLDSS